jgi:hypothetical protein
VTSRTSRLTVPLLVLLLACSFSFGAIIKTALAVSYHVTCVGHGFVEGSSQTDGSWFSRVEQGCGSTYRYCEVDQGSTALGSEEAYGTTGGTCNAWSRTFANFSECQGAAWTSNPGVFSYHGHNAPNWCL